MNSTQHTHVSGFSLIELLMAVIIIGILSSLAMPGFQYLIKQNRITTASNSLAGAISYARTEAVKRGNSVHFGAAAGAHVSVTAAEAANLAWVVWVDADGDNNWDSGEELRLWQAVNSNITVKVSNNSAVFNNFFVFNSSGTVNNADNFTVCDDRASETGRQTELFVSGLFSSVSFNCP